MNVLSDRRRFVYRFRYILAVLIVVVCIGGALLFLGAEKGTARDFAVSARQYAYDPAVLHINRGDTVRLQLRSLDVVHGFFLEGFDIDVHIFPSPPKMMLRDQREPGGFREVDEIVFIADKSGKFRYRCSHTCGPLHPFMQGEMIIRPNYPFTVSVFAAIGIAAAGVFLIFFRNRQTTSDVQHR